MKRALAGSLLALSVGVAALAGYTMAQPHALVGGERHEQALADSGDEAMLAAPTVDELMPAGGLGAGSGPVGDDYPWRSIPKDSMLDPWREYVRECTSFVAWRLHSQNGFEMPFHANAKDWGSKAAALGYIVDGKPVRGSVGWSDAGKWGHVVWVVAVDGPNVTIEEYNRDFTGNYGVRTAPASSFRYIHFKDLADLAPVPELTPGSSAPPVIVEPGPSPALQGGQGPVQGSSQPVQGSAPMIQGSGPDIQGSTTPVQPNGGVGGAAPQPSTTTTARPAAPQTWLETAGGVAHTWTNYSNAGGQEGPPIAGSQTVQIACKVQGFRVADGNTWWYRIGQAPWNGQFYVSADAFYNNGATSGSLHGTPFVDPAVRDC